MPGLWSNLVLTRRLRIDALQDVQVLLARARHMPRSLTLFTRKRPVIPNLVLDLIAPYRYRRLILSLHVEEVDAFARLFFLQPQWTSGLQELALYKCQKSQFAIPFSLFPPDAQLSELTSLKLKVYQTINTQFLAHANSWCKLRHLQMSTRVAAQCAFEVVRHCSATLETCHLVLGRDVAFAAWAPSLIEHVPLPTLQALAITFYDGQDVEPFIRPLVLPSLVSLSLYTPYSEDVYLRCDVSLFVHLTQRSSGMPHIEALHIDRAEDPVDLGTILRAMPSLNEITLDPLSPLEVDALNGLVTGELGPCLERLYVGTVEDDHELTLHMMRQGRNRHAQSRDGPNKIPPLHLEFLPL